MLVAIVATALSVAQVASLEVPYVPQTDALCGGAAAAMVFRYWGDAHANVERFAALVERRDGVAGIVTERLAESIAGAGWRIERADASLAGLRRRIDAKQPVITLIGDKRDTYHYVVVVGADGDAVVIHDPSWGPSRSIPARTFERLWSAAHHWSLVVLPSDSILRRADSEEPASPSVARESTACDDKLNQAIADVSARGLDSADEILAPVRAACPDSPGPYRELAGVRFAQKRWQDAESLARQALARDARDSYANEVLGSSLFMLDDPEGALAAWNRIGKPRLDLVRIEGVRHSRYQSIADALGLVPNRLLTPEAFRRAKHRLEELPDGIQTRLSVTPQEDGFASIDVAILERSGMPRGRAAWTGTAVRAAVDRESSIAMPGFTGQGEIWTASWRWWRNRPRVAFGFAAPRVGGLFGVWRVEGSWEAETYARAGSIRREVHKHAGLTVSDWMNGSVRYALNAGLDVWDGGRRATAVGGSLERRFLRDRLSIGGHTTAWIPVDTGSSFAASGARFMARSASNARGWIYEGTLGAERVTTSAPLAVWPGAGEGRARATTLRAHPLLDDGMIEIGPESAFGRSMQYANAEAQRWLSRPHVPRLGVAAFVDVVRATQRVDNGIAFQADVGAGLRLRIPGAGKVLRVDVARGLKDGNTALTVGFAY